MDARGPAPVSSPASPPQGAGWSHAENIVLALVVLAGGGISGWAASTQADGLPAAFAMLVTFSAVAVAISRETIVEAIRAHPAGSRWRRLLVDEAASAARCARGVRSPPAGSLTVATGNRRPSSALRGGLLPGR